LRVGPPPAASRPTHRRRWPRRACCADTDAWAAAAHALCLLPYIGGVAADHRVAFRVVRRARATGNLAATTLLAQRYRDGCGAPENHVHAATLFRAAAARGDTVAAYHLARTADGVPLAAAPGRRRRAGGSAVRAGRGGASTGSAAWRRTRPRRGAGTRWRRATAT
jgi:TPR repeat protein